MPSTSASNESTSASTESTGASSSRTGELRRHFGVLVAQVRQERTVAEMVVANTEAISRLRLRLDAR